ncbi:MAG: alkaline shock response membrane anchor protein AmaP [Clostridia bacterium]|nr:alkaline shock response membrane anchor protein AmaP [Clostridia bacterium]
MKIRVIDRVILFVLASVALITGVCAALGEFGIDVLALVQPYLNVELSKTAALLVRIVGIAVLVLLSAYLYSVACRRKKKPSPFIDMDSGNKGSIRMSMDSISSLVLQTCSNLPGLSGLKVSTVNHEDSVSVDLAFQVEMNRNIPELSSQIQQIVGEVVERNCGVAVRNVCVTVSGFTPPRQEHPALPPQKVEKRGWFRKGRTAQPIAAATVEEEPEVEPLAAEEDAPVTEPVMETPAEESEAVIPEPEVEPATESDFEEPAAEEDYAEHSGDEDEEPELPERE